MKNLLTWIAPFETFTPHTEQLTAQKMRTKTLLLTAALSAAGVATSMAQVFSVNAVGYVTKQLDAGKFYLISNPLIASDNSINKLFTGVPAGTQIFKFGATGFVTATFDDLDNAFVPAAAGAATVNPGEGVFIKAPKAATVTFVGEVPTGSLENKIAKGLSIISSQVPQGGTAKELGLTGAAGDQIFQWDVAGQTYKSFNFDDLDNDWVPKLAPLGVGEAFFYSSKNGGSWKRTFSVN